jgi:hypothetical protein
MFLSIMSFSSLGVVSQPGLKDSQRPFLLLSKMIAFYGGSSGIRLSIIACTPDPDHIRQRANSSYQTLKRDINAASKSVAINCDSFLACNFNFK